MSTLAKLGSIYASIAPSRRPGSSVFIELEPPAFVRFRSEKGSARAALDSESLANLLSELDALLPEDLPLTLDRPAPKWMVLDGTAGSVKLKLADGSTRTYECEPHVFVPGDGVWKVCRLLGKVAREHFRQSSIEAAVEDFCSEFIDLDDPAELATLLAQSISEAMQALEMLCASPTELESIDPDPAVRARRLIQCFDGFLLLSHPEYLDRVSDGKEKIAQLREPVAAVRAAIFAWAGDGAVPSELQDLARAALAQVAMG